MRDGNKSKEQLIDELRELRERLAAYEAIEPTRRHTEEELAKSRATLTAAIECLPFDFFAVDTDGRCVLQNAVSRQLYGDALGKTSEQVCPDERALPRWLEGTRRALAGERVERETEMQVAGEHRHFYSLLAPIQNEGMRYGMLGVNVDITARKQAEEALRRSEARYRALAESTRDIIYILDRQGTLLYANQAASQCIGIPCGEIVGKRQADLFPQEMARAHVERIERAFATGETLERDELFHFGPEEVWLRVHLFPLRDEAGNVTSVMGVAHNITERKRAEEALRKSHDDLDRKVKERTAELAIFQRFAEASGRGFGMTDLDGRITYVNPTLCRLFGEQKPEDVIGKHVSTYYPEGYVQRREREILPVVLRGEPWHGEQVVLSRHGTFVPTYQTRFLIPDENGEPLLLGVVVADISELKQAEAALRASEERYELAVRGVGVGIWDYDIRTGKVYYSPRWKALFGYDEQDIGDSLEDWAKLLHPEEHDRVLKIQDDFLASTSNTVTAEYRLRHKDGSYRWIVAHGLAVRDEQGRACRFVGSHGDITERRQAQEDLRESEERLRFHTEHSPLGVIEWDADFRLSRWTGDAERIFGWKAEEVLGKRLDEFPWVYEKDVEEVDHVSTGLRHGTCTRSVSHNRNYRKDGSVIHCEWYNSSLMDATGSLRSVLSLVLDVTERKQAQDGLERERQSLWRMLQASDHERQIISYEIHDGLAQYLAAAGMQFQAHDALKENSPDEAKKAYETAVELVRQAHSESRRLINEVRPPVIDENGIETAVSHLVHEQRRRGGPQIECRSDVRFGRLASILENALYRIAQEALTNACKHSKSKKVTVTMTQEEQEVRLEVQDWGVGFDPEVVGKGHFGLEGIRQRVRLLGGRLTIESTPGSGTMIQAVVPILEKQIER